MELGDRWLFFQNVKPQLILNGLRIFVAERSTAGSRYIRQSIISLTAILHNIMDFLFPGIVVDFFAMAKKTDMNCYRSSVHPVNRHRRKLTYPFTTSSSNTKVSFLCTISGATSDRLLEVFNIKTFPGREVDGNRSKMGKNR
jgi:hypothetical protein